MNERIKKLRKFLELTQQEFADKIKVKRNTVATYEMGRSEPSDAAISLICKEFGVNETWLRSGIGSMFVEVSKDEEISNFVAVVLEQKSCSFQRRLISMLSKLTAKEWELLEKMAVELMRDQSGLEAGKSISITNETSIYRAAKSKTDTEAEIIEDNDGLFDRLLSLPAITSEEDL